MQPCASIPPGLGGYMHGMYWQLSVAPEALPWLHITVLELLAAAFSAMIFAKLAPAPARISLMVDATSAYLSLADESEHSEVLAFAHHRLFHEDRFRSAANLCDVLHGAGDANIAGDAASRSRWEMLTEHLLLRCTSVCKGCQFLLYAKKSSMMSRPSHPVEA